MVQSEVGSSQWSISEHTRGLIRVLVIKGSSSEGWRLTIREGKEGLQGAQCGGWYSPVVQKGGDKAMAWGGVVGSRDWSPHLCNKGVS